MQSLCLQFLTTDHMIWCMLLPLFAPFTVAFLRNNLSPQVSELTSTWNLTFYDILGSSEFTLSLDHSRATLALSTTRSRYLLCYCLRQNFVIFSSPLPHEGGVVFVLSLSILNPLLLLLTYSFFYGSGNFSKCTPSLLVLPYLISSSLSHIQIIFNRFIVLSEPERSKIWVAVIRHEFVKIGLATCILCSLVHMISMHGDEYILKGDWVLNRWALSLRRLWNVPLTQPVHIWWVCILVGIRL